MKKPILGLVAICALVAGPAMAADMPVKAPPMAAAVAGYSWTGLYIGGEFGYGWASETQTVITQSSATPGFPVGFSGTRDLQGLFGGLNGGFNYQFNQFVIGLDGDYVWSGINGTTVNVSPTTGDVSNHSDSINWIATVTGRLGMVFANNWLLYGKGGWAWAEWQDNSTNFNSTLTTLRNTSSVTETRDGWTAGGGIEWGFAPGWSAKVEYDHIEFNGTTFAVTEVNARTGAVTFPTRSQTSHLDMVKAGIEYHFNFGGFGGPVGARY